MASLDEYIREDRDFARRRGDRLNRDAEDRANVDRQRYDQLLKYSDPMFMNLAEGRGGYSPGEREDILREDETRAGMTTPEEYQRNYFTPDEAAGIRGDPWSRGRAYNPGEMADRQYESEGAIRRAVGEMEAGMREAVDPAVLAASGGYFEGLEGAQGGMEGRVRGAIDPTRLRADEAGLDSIRMSPEEEARMVESAGITAGKAHGAQMQDMERKMRAAGIPTSGIAAYRGRNMRNAAVDAADARTQAAVAASNSRAGRAATAENIRQAGEQGYVRSAVPAELSLGRSRLGTTQAAEDTRLSGARDIANRRGRTAEVVGRARAGSEADMEQARRQRLQFQAGLGTDIARDIDDTRSGRNADLAYNRQGTNRANQQQRFGQNFPVSEALSRRSGQVAEARQRDSREGRSYVREQIPQTTGREQSEYNRQANVYGQQGNQMQGTTRSKYAESTRPKTWEKVVGAALGGFGALAPVLPWGKNKPSSSGSTADLSSAYAW